MELCAFDCGVVVAFGGEGYDAEGESLGYGAGAEFCGGDEESLGYGA